MMQRLGNPDHLVVEVVVDFQLQTVVVNHGGVILDRSVAVSLLRILGSFADFQSRSMTCPSTSIRASTTPSMTNSPSSNRNLRSESNHES